MQPKASSNSRTETTKRKPAASIRCAFCLSEARQDDRYCGQCGEELQTAHNPSTTDGDLASPEARGPACIKCGSTGNPQGNDCSICGLASGPKPYWQKLLYKTKPWQLITLALLPVIVLIAYTAGNQRQPAPVAQLDSTPQTLPAEKRLNRSIARIEQQIKLAGPGQGRRDLLDECLYLRASLYEQNRNPERALADLAQISSDFPDQEQVLAKIISLKTSLSASPTKSESPRKFARKSRVKKSEKNAEKRSGSKQNQSVQIETKKHPGQSSFEKPKAEPPISSHRKDRPATTLKTIKPVKKAKAADDQQSYNSFLIRYFKEGLTQEDELKEPPSYEEWRASKKPDSRSQGSR